MTDWDTVSIDSVRAAYALLGLDEADFDRTSKVEIGPRWVKVTRHRLDEAGHTMAEDGVVLVDVTKVEIYRDSAPAVQS